MVVLTVYDRGNAKKVGPCRDLYPIGEKTGTAYIYRKKMGMKKVVYSIINGMAIFEGDILLGKVENLESRSKAAIISDADYRWPQNIVDYSFDDDFTSQGLVRQAISHWEIRSPIHFTEHVYADVDWFHSAIIFTETSEEQVCNSPVGCQGSSPQYINLPPSCVSLGTAIHEIGHALGLWHEHSREDRDSFIQINWFNIINGKEFNFDQHIVDSDDIGPYDFASIMHYGPLAWSNNIPGVFTTITPLVDGGNTALMGQQQGESFGDMEAVWTMYNGDYFPPTSSGFMIQGRFGNRNYEVVVPTTRGLLHYWKDNPGVIVDPLADPFLDYPWSSPEAVVPIRLPGPTSLIQSNFGQPGSLEVVVRVGKEVQYLARDSGPLFKWSEPFTFAWDVSGNPALIQSRLGIRGNFEVVVPRVGGGIAHYFRNNDSRTLWWSSETVIDGSIGNVDALCLIQSSYGSPGNLEIVVRKGNKLYHYWRDCSPALKWNRPFFIARGHFSGIPSLLQSKFGPSLFEVVVPQTNGGIIYYSRNNDAAGSPWSTNPIVIIPASVTGNKTLKALTMMIYSTIPDSFNLGSGQGQLEILALHDNFSLTHYRHKNGTNWIGPVTLPAS